MSDFEPEDAVDETADEWEVGFATWTTHTELDTDKALRSQDLVTAIKRNTTNEFIIESVNLASMLRNTLGDADGVVADAANQIIANLNLVSTEIHKDPCGFMLAFIRSIEDDNERKQTARAAAARLLAYADQS